MHYWLTCTAFLMADGMVVMMVGTSTRPLSVASSRCTLSDSASVLRCACRHERASTDIQQVCHPYNACLSFSRPLSMCAADVFSPHTDMMHETKHTGGPRLRQVPQRSAQRRRCPARPRLPQWPQCHQRWRTSPCSHRAAAKSAGVNVRNVWSHAASPTTSIHDQHPVPTGPHLEARVQLVHG